MNRVEGNKTEKERSHESFKCEILSFDPSSQAVKYSLTQLFNRALAMTTATTRKTLLEKKPLPSCDYFAVVLILQC